MRTKKEILDSLELQLKAVNKLVFSWRTLERKRGLNNEERYAFRVLKLRQRKLKRQVQGLTNSI